MHAFFPPYVFKSASQCNCSTCGLLTEVFSHDRSRRWAVVTHACPAELHASQCPGHSSYGPLRQTPTARLSTGPGQTHGWQTAGRWSTPHSKVSFPHAFDRLMAGKLLGRWSTPHSKVSFPQAFDRLMAGKFLGRWATPHSKVSFP